MYIYLPGLTAMYINVHVMFQSFKSALTSTWVLAKKNKYFMAKSTILTLHQFCWVGLFVCFLMKLCLFAFSPSPPVK